MSKVSFIWGKVIGPSLYATGSLTVNVAYLTDDEAKAMLAAVALVRTMQGVLV